MPEQPKDDQWFLPRLAASGGIQMGIVGVGAAMLSFFTVGTEQSLLLILSKFAAGVAAGGFIVCVVSFLRVRADIKHTRAKLQQRAELVEALQAMNLTHDEAATAWGYLKAELSKIEKGVDGSGAEAKRLTPFWPEIWEACALLLPGKIRVESYDPGKYDLHQDYLLCQERYHQRRWMRRWAGFCFTVRSAFHFMKCLRLAYGSLLWVLPQPVRKWWTSE